MIGNWEMSKMRRRQFLIAAGALLATPTNPLAQSTPKLPRIALVEANEQATNMREGRHPYWGALLSELRSLGRIEGKTVTIDRWSGSGDTGAYGELARKIVASDPQCIVARGRTITSPIAAATEKIPIVSVGTISSEMRASLAHPGRNITGLSASSNQQQIYSKALEFLGELAKANARIAWLGPRLVWDGPAGESVRVGARNLNVTLQPVFVASPLDEAAIVRAFASIKGGKFDALLVSPATELFPHRGLVAKLALEAKLPSMANGSSHVEAGILMSYAAVFEDLYRQAAHYVDKILKGTKPSDLPIEYPSKVELVVNMKTARSLGIKFPQSILARADRLIE